MAFSESVKNAVWVRQDGRCGDCGKKLRVTGIAEDYHHIKPKQFGGEDTVDNCVMLCEDPCHRKFAHPGGTKNPVQINKSEFRYAKF